MLYLYGAVYLFGRPPSQWHLNQDFLTAVPRGTALVIAVFLFFYAIIRDKVHLLKPVCLSSSRLSTNCSQLIQLVCLAGF